MLLPSNWRVRRQQSPTHPHRTEKACHVGPQLDVRQIRAGPEVLCPKATVAGPQKHHDCRPHSSEYGPRAPASAWRRLRIQALVSLDLPLGLNVASNLPRHAFDAEGAEATLS
jgi:hypothetical protein